VIAYGLARIVSKIIAPAGLVAMSGRYPDRRYAATRTTPRSSDIYWGALPWVGLQAIMVVLVIAFPITVTALLDKPSTVDPNKVRIDIPQIELPPLDFSEPPKFK
jgi:TRAP-type mannitol/chloroaromatic compound transport system permease large subunit